MRTLQFCVVGGDARMKYLALQLARDGHIVCSVAHNDAPTDLSVLKWGDCVVLPMPAADSAGMLYTPGSTLKIPMAAVLDAMRRDQLIFGGKIPFEVHRLAGARGLTIRDYLLRDELAIANAIPTAEGALQLAMDALPCTIHQSRVLVVGFGRVGQCTAARFRALGAEVAVAARNPGQLALAESLGCTPIPLPHLGDDDSHWDLVINTVPCPVLGERQLCRANRPLLMELASSPGGFDTDWVTEAGLRLISAPGLPGRVAPATAARAIRTTLYAMLEESGI